MSLVAANVDRLDAEELAELRSFFAFVATQPEAELTPRTQHVLAALSREVHVEQLRREADWLTAVFGLRKAGLTGV